jgi:hypothetical protein
MRPAPALVERREKKRPKSSPKIAPVVIDSAKDWWRAAAFNAPPKAPMPMPMTARTRSEETRNLWLVTGPAAPTLLVGIWVVGAEFDRDAMLRVGSAEFVAGALLRLSEDISLVLEFSIFIWL